MKKKLLLRSIKSYVRSGNLPLPKDDLMKKVDLFLQIISAAFKANALLKITLSNKREKTADVTNVYIKPVVIKETVLFSFIYRHPTKDITKNLEETEAVKVISDLLHNSFFNADLYVSSHTYYFTADKNGDEKLVTKTVLSVAKEPVLTHDKVKNRIIDADALYLKELGVTTAEGKVKKEMQHKFRQINRYVEIIEGILNNADMKPGFNVVDMGSGKGYLTFALYDYLQGKNMHAKVSGTELREDLVTKCNLIANQCGYTGLHFQKGSIQDSDTGGADMLIALHACDTATDDAIIAGIKADTKIIICAPCCHKQLRKQMAPANALMHITKHGILLERQAEMVTDTIRALIMEAHGYKTKVFDFIEEEHTPKNIIIVGIKGEVSEKIMQENMEKVIALKELFGIKEHYLERSLKESFSLKN